MPRWRPRQARQPDGRGLPDVSRRRTTAGIVPVSNRGALLPVLRGGRTAAMVGTMRIADLPVKIKAGYAILYLYIYIVERIAAGPPSGHMQPGHRSPARRSCDSRAAWFGAPPESAAALFVRVVHANGRTSQRASAAVFSGLSSELASNQLKRA